MSSGQRESLVVLLSDASRPPTRAPVVTIALIIANAVCFALELAGGEPFVTRWSVVPGEITAGHHWITLLTAMFMHGSWLHILGNMIFLWAFGPAIEESMGRLRAPIRRSRASAQAVRSPLSWAPSSSHIREIASRRSSAAEY